MLRAPRASSETPLLHSPFASSSAPSHAARKAAASSSSTSTAAFVLLSIAAIVVGLAEQGLQKLILTALFNYRWFFVQFTCLCSCVALGALCHAHRAEITAEMQDVSKVRAGSLRDESINKFSSLNQASWVILR